MTECGWCFEKMVPLEVTHPNPSGIDEGEVGSLCRNCGRIYLDELIPAIGTIRLDAARDGDLA